MTDWQNNRNSDGEETLYAKAAIPTNIPGAFTGYVRIVRVQAWFDGHLTGATLENILNKLHFYLEGTDGSTDEWILDNATDAGEGIPQEVIIPAGRTVIGWE